MDPENIDQITAAVVGLGTVASLAIGLAKRFGGERFVLIRKLFGAITKLVVAINKKLG